jgi:hypothetical protein|eukprot:COSAG02_NODE_97_length_37159_cov_37.660335_39_plen_469_part_00
MDVAAPPPIHKVDDMQPLDAEHMHELGVVERAAPGDEHVCELGAAERAAPAMPPEVFEHILALLADGATLQAAAGVCRKWRRMCLEKEFWLYLTRRRFFVSSVANPRLHRGGPDSFGWIDLYKNWESALKLPACAWTRDRVFPVFAQTLTSKMLRKEERKQKDLARALRRKQKQKQQNVAGLRAPPAAAAPVPRVVPAAAPLAVDAAPTPSALVWVTVRHYEDCKLRPCLPRTASFGSQSAGCLELRVLVQNTTDAPLWIRPGAMELHCRPPGGHSPSVQCSLEQGWEDGWCTRSIVGDMETPRFISMSPLPLEATDPLEDGLAVCAARKLAYHIAHPSVDTRTLLDENEGDWAGRTDEAPPIAGSICLSQRWSFAVFGSVRFPVGIAALDKPQIEPEALERCARLRVPLFTSEREAANAAASVGDRATQVPAFASARFDEDTIWTHFTNITGQIWFFEPVVSSTAGF